MFQEEGGGQVAEVVEPDVADVGLVEQGVEVPGEGGALDRVAVGSGGDVAAAYPACAGGFAFRVLPVAVLFEGAQARCR